MLTDTHKIKLTESNRSYIIDKSVCGDGYAEALKLSNLENVSVSVTLITGGYEDCIDIVRGKNYNIHNSALRSGNKTRTFITAKGGIDGLVLENLLISGKTSFFWDISLGDHTIYNDIDSDLPVMKNVTINNVKRVNGKKVRILCLYCENPKLVNGKYTLIKIPISLVRIFFSIKRFVAKVRKLPHMV